MFVKIRDDFAKEIVAKGVDPSYFVNRILHQHFAPWAHINYENELIDKVLEDEEISDRDLMVIHKYLSYHVLKDFKERMYKRYDHSTAPNSLDYLLKRLSVAIIECSFNRKKLSENYSYLISQINSKAPGFNVDTYVDNYNSVS